MTLNLLNLLNRIILTRLSNSPLECGQLYHKKITNFYEFRLVSAVFILHSPLEQFDLHRFLHESFYLILVFCLIVMAFLFAVGYAISVGKFWWYVSRIFFFNVIKNLVKNNLGSEHQLFFPIIYFIFLYILLANLLSFLPYQYCITAVISFTAYMAFISFFGLFFLAVFTYKDKFFNCFVPSNVPEPIMKFVIFIEGLSFCVRLISLPVRLLANVIAGHCLMKLLVCFSFICLCEVIDLGNTGTFTGALGIWFVVIFILSLELLIAFLQAYVFVFLLTVYLGQALRAGMKH